MRILITGVAGFIGFHLAQRLLADGCSVVGLDNLNDYYDVQLKKDRLLQLESEHTSLNKFIFCKVDIADAKALEDILHKYPCSHVVHLAAQAGVRYSLQNPSAYFQSNLLGFGNILECCRKYRIEHLVFASSSSVYGLDTEMPYSPHRGADHPVSLYAATKRSNELMAHAYSHLYGLPCSGLRFFTVYGAWGRPDMSPHIFTSAILANQPIRLFNNGCMRRDFTYIDDIVDGVVRLLPHLPEPVADCASIQTDPARSSAPWRIYNIGNGQSVELRTFVSCLEQALGKTAKYEFLPMQPGDVKQTWSDLADLAQVVDFAPKTTLEEGLKHFVRWHLEYYGHGTNSN